MVGIAQYDDDGNKGSAKEEELIKIGLEAKKKTKKVKPLSNKELDNNTSEVFDL